MLSSSMKRLAVSTRNAVPPFDFQICVVHGRPVTVGRILRGSVGLLFALIQGARKISASPEMSPWARVVITQRIVGMVI